MLLVSGWQTVNIGDVAHTPGTVRALHELGGAEVVLWPRRLGARERTMLKERFPALRILGDARDSAPDELTDEVREAIGWADVCVHASGPSLVGAEQIDLWRAHTDKPYGFFGITVDPLSPYADSLERSGRIIRAIDGDLLAPEDRARLAEAAFVWCRDSLTAEFLATQGLDRGVAFGPDATVVVDVEDEAAADRFVTETGVRPGRFVCVVPRLRYTPYHELRDDGRSPSEVRRDAINAGWVDRDLGLLRDVVTAYVRRTDDDVVVVPEMSYAVALAQQRLADWPADVAHRVHVLPRFWELGEAASVYRRATAVLSMECHSPLIALAQGTPALYLRQSTDTVKGQMYADLGAADRIRELDDAEPGEVLTALLALRGEEARARTRTLAQDARERVARMVDAVPRPTRAPA
ncbi:polysaccharide pyruvyl transferase family protein [Actinotalea caeni]